MAPHQKHIRSDRLILKHIFYPCTRLKLLQGGVKMCESDLQLAFKVKGSKVKVTA